MGLFRHFDCRLPGQADRSKLRRPLLGSGCDAFPDLGAAHAFAVAAVGVGLVELVVGIAIVGMLMSTVGLTLVSILKTSTQTQDQLSATHQLRTAFYWLNQDTQSGVAALATVAAGDVTMQWTDHSTATTYSSRFQQVGTELQRTLTTTGSPATQVVGRNLVPGGFTAVRTGNSVEYTITVVEGDGTKSRTETATMRVADEPLTPFPTVTPNPNGCNGLDAAYYNNMNFTSLAMARVDAVVDFNWGTSAPDPSVGADTFSVRWIGEVEAQFTETYTFYTQSDDGVRLWVDNTLLINNWTDHSSTENSGNTKPGRSDTRTSSVRSFSSFAR